MKRLLVVYPQFVPHRFEDFIQDRKLKRQGDLAKMSNLDVSHIFEHQLVPKQNDTYMNMGPKKSKILFFGDSFTDFFLKDYFHRHFNDVQMIYDLRSVDYVLKKHQVLEYRPDVVIYQSVERHWVD
jgi:hypothetical protein